MDTPTHGVAESIGKALGVSAVVIFFASMFSLILLASWNLCVPQVFGGNEITLQQSMAMLGVAWTLSAVTRMKL